MQQLPKKKGQSPSAPKINLAKDFFLVSLPTRSITLWWREASVVKRGTNKSEVTVPVAPSRWAIIDRNKIRLMVVTQKYPEVETTRLDEMNKKCLRP